MSECARYGSGRRPVLLSLAAFARVLLALLAALQLSAGLQAERFHGRGLGARGSQLQPLLPPPPPPPLVRRALLSSLPPPRRLQRRPSRHWWDSLQPLWSDEFDGSVLDSSKWEVMEGDGSQFGIPGWGNSELQNYTRRWTNVRVMNGSLVLQAQAEPPGSPHGPYTSGRLRTAGRFAIAPSPSFPLVRLEARIQLEAGDGMWPAFWMLPQDWVYGNWPQSGEIDIMEAKNGMDSVLGSLHFGGTGALRTINGGTPAQLADGAFHVFALEWEADRMRWYLDGRQYLQAYSSNGTGAPPGWFTAGADPARHPHAPFDHPHHVLLNLAVGGNFPWVDPAAVARTLAAGPRRMLVDYVRVHGRAYR